MSLKTTARCLSVAAMAAFASTAQAQTPAPAAPPPPAYAPPPPAYAPPPPAYAPPGYYAPPPGYAAPGPAAWARRPGAETHDGTYVRLHFGLGYSAMTATAPGGVQAAKFSGDSVSFGVAVGGAVTQNLILYGTFLTTGLVDPTVTINGQSVVSPNISIDDFGLGAGVAYYLEPANLYLSGAFVFNQIELDGSSGNKITETDFGAGFQGIVGKEWWASDNWGLGVAAEFRYGRMKDKNDTFGNGAQPTWSNAAFSLLFSATFN